MCAPGEVTLRFVQSFDNCLECPENSGASVVALGCGAAALYTLMAAGVAGVRARRAALAW